jgi:hypothetical protein
MTNITTLLIIYVAKNFKELKNTVVIKLSHCYLRDYSTFYTYEDNSVYRFTRNILHPLICCEVAVASR